VSKRYTKPSRDALDPPADLRPLADIMLDYEAGIDKWEEAYGNIPDLVQRVETLESFVNFMLRATVELVPASRTAIVHANAEYEWVAIVRDTSTDTLYWGRTRREALVKAWEASQT
jgi:hypothetical protein